MVEVSIRPATDEDVPSLAVMGMRFVKASPYGQHMLPSPYDIAQGLRSMLAVGGVAFVAEVGKELVGAIVAIKAPLWFSPGTLVATELAWWVDKEHQGATGVRLLREFERWATEVGAQFFALSDLEMPGNNAGSLIERLGYRLVERSHMRRVG